MLRRIASARYFQNFITIIIVLASVLVGVETYPEIEKQYHRLLHTLDLLIIGIFTLEVVIKIGAEGRHPLRYFRDPWNVFDFTIVAACYLPFDNH